MNKKLPGYITIILIFFFVFSVYAHGDETLFNVVNLQAQAEREIPNDQIIVILAAEHEGSKASVIADKINQDTQWALQIIKKHNFIESKTRNYQTYPVYNKQVIAGWRANQEIEIKSENISGLTEIAGQLQERLQIKQMNFSPTEVTRKNYENELIEEAMMAFKERIAIVKKHMDNKDHRIVNINISTGAFQPPIMYERAAMKTMAMDVTPAVEAGTSKITVTVNGSVQFF